MLLPANPFKRALKHTLKHTPAGPAQLGLWLALANAYSAELCAAAGFDWLLIDGEHAPNDIRAVLSQLQAVAPYASHPVVRPLTGDAALIKQLLDIGVQTLLIPMVETAEQAAAMVSAIHYPPRGIRGVGASLGRASHWGLVDDYLGRAADEICLLLQIETAKGLENLDAIAAVDGIDGIFIGPADLAASLGHPGDLSHPQVLERIDQALAALRSVGKPSGILATDPALARKYLDAGVNFVAVGADTSVLRQGLGQLLSRYRQTAANPTQGKGQGY